VHSREAAVICLTVTPTSRRLAQVDLLNAAAHADVVELCLDQLAKEPDVGEMIAGIRTPIIVSCRRPAEGGHYKGTEEQRLALLRMAVVAGPAYVELEPDTAKKIPPFGNTQRIVSWISPDKPLGNVDDLYEELVRDCRADVVKFSWRTDSLDEAWSLLAAIGKQREKPVVGVGIGLASRMVQILGAKYGAHWIYAALEPEMAVHENDATLFELEGVYDLKAITKQTRFVGFVGFPQEVESRTVRVFNAGFRHLDLPFRCLPIHLRRTDKSREMLEKLKLSALVVHPESGVKALGVAEHQDKGARQGQCADLVFRQKQGWTAYNLFWRNTAEALAEVLPESARGAKGLEKRNVLLVGAGGLAQSVALGVREFGGELSVAAPDDAEASQLAKMFSGRHVPYASLYDTLADVVVFADPALRVGSKRTEVNPGFLRPSMTVLDVCRMPEEGDFTREARDRGCRVVDVAAVYARQLGQQFEAMTQQPLPPEALAALR
jgi:3-dehydroquinate dehydratase / shikimate dehydrogenase